MVADVLLLVTAIVYMLVVGIIGVYATQRVKINPNNECSNKREAAIFISRVPTLHILTRRWQQCVEE
jgi:hypothetical protein